MLLVAKYQAELKKKGLELNEETASLTLALYKQLLDHAIKITNDQNNDQTVTEAALLRPLLATLEGFAGHMEAQASKTTKRPTIMRKNSLKKVEELPAVRPSSRGKLSSLSKRAPPGSKAQP